MTSSRFPDDEPAVDGASRDALWRLRARLVTPPVSDRAERDLAAIYEAAAEYAHEDQTVRQLHQRRFATLDRIGRVAAVVVLIGGSAAGIASLDDDPAIFPIVEGSTEHPLGADESSSDAEAADEVSDAGESASPAEPGGEPGEPAPVPTVTITETETEVVVVETESGEVAAPSQPTSAPTTSAPGDPPVTSEPETPADQPTTTPTDDPNDVGEGFGGRGDRPCPTTPSPSDSETEPGDDPTDPESPDAEASDNEGILLPPWCQPSPSPSPTESGDDEGEDAEATPGSTESPDASESPADAFDDADRDSVLP